MLVEADTICRSQTVVDQYMDDVLSGKIPACEYLKLAVRRHLSDLKNCSDRGLYFDPEAAQHNIDFTEKLKQSKGRWAGKHLQLQPWQVFIKWCIYGWKKFDGTRRFRFVYKEIARKNGKSTELASDGLYGLGFDGEGGAEIYSVATKEDQARITLKEGQSMTRKSGYLDGMALVHKKSISIDEYDSTWQALGRDSNNQDGLNPHMVLVDEFHAHPDRSMLDVMDSAVGSREQPLLYIVTTAGFNMQSACYQERDYAIKVLKGVVDDDTYFAIIFTLDMDEQGNLLDDWKDENTWIKANPNLGVTVSIDDMRRMMKKAIESPAALNNFLTKKLNIWTTQELKWVNVEKWKACNRGIDEKMLLGRKCFAGLDLSSNNDIAGYGLVFELDDGSYYFKPKYYVPKENAQLRERRDRVPYLAWAQEGLITLTPGDVVDYSILMADLLADGQKYDIQYIAFDRWGFESIRQMLIGYGLDEKIMVSFGQGFLSMSAPMKYLEKIYLEGNLVHNNNPVTNWMAGNVAAKMDPAGNLKPDKSKSSEKIDGIVMLIMGLAMAITQPEKKDSVYEKRGILRL